MEKSKKLFNFEFDYKSSNKYLDLSKIMFDKYNLDFSCKKIDFKIYKENKILENSFSIDYIKLLYEQKNLSICFNNCMMTIDFQSNLFSYLSNQENSLIEQDINNEKEKKSKINENSELIDNFINKFNIEGKKIDINFIYGKKEDKTSIYLLIDNWNCQSICLDFVNSENNIIVKSEKNLIIQLEKKLKLIKAEIDSVIFYSDLQNILQIYDNFQIESNKNKNNNNNILENDKQLYRFDITINNLKYDLNSLMYLFSHK